MLQKSDRTTKKIANLKKKTTRSNSRTQRLGTQRSQIHTLRSRPRPARTVCSWTCTRPWRTPTLPTQATWTPWTSSGGRRGRAERTRLWGRVPDRGGDRSIRRVVDTRATPPSSQWPEMRLCCSGSVISDGDQTDDCSGLESRESLRVGVAEVAVAGRRGACRRPVLWWT